MSSQEGGLRDVASSAWQALIGGNKEGNLSKHVHDECAILLLKDDNGSYTTERPATIEWPSACKDTSFVVEYVKISPVGK
jgi:hypothetical protein